MPSGKLIQAPRQRDLKSCDHGIYHRGWPAARSWPVYPACTGVPRSSAVCPGARPLSSLHLVSLEGCHEDRMSLKLGACIWGDFLRLRPATPNRAPKPWQSRVPARHGAGGVAARQRHPSVNWQRREGRTSPPYHEGVGAAGPPWSHRVRMGAGTPRGSRLLTQGPFPSGSHDRGHARLLLARCFPSPQ